MLKITNQQQWEQRITSESVCKKWGDPELITSMVTRRRLEWLGHMARMPDCCISKKILFGWLPKTRPAGGPHKRWCNHIRRYLKLVGVPESDWYHEATHSRNAAGMQYTVLAWMMLLNRNSNNNTYTQSKNQSKSLARCAKHPSRASLVSKGTNTYTRGTNPCASNVGL